MTTRKQLIVTVASGLCNRLWVLACALRLADQSGRRVVLLWPDRVGRFGLPFEGDESSSFEDFFLPDVESLAAAIPVGKPPTMQSGAIGLDYSDLYELAQPGQIADGLDLSPEVVAKATEPRILDLHDPRVAEATDVWIHLSTMPVGGPQDGMERYIAYPSRLGHNKKDELLESLSTYTRRIQIRPSVRQTVDEIVTGMRKAPGGARLVGIHVRGTDLRQRSAVDRNADLADIIHNCTCLPGQAARIFLACDSEEWATEFIQTHVRPQSRRAITTYGNSRKTENSVAGARAALVDLFTLATCDVIYGTAGSSFSSYAWLLSDAEFWIHS